MENMEDKNEPPENTSSDKRNPIAWIVAIFLIIWGLGSLLYHWWVEQYAKVYKGVLIVKYGVNKKTFAKWMRWIYYQDEEKFQDYTKKKKLPKYEIDNIIKFFGEPTLTMPVLTKGQIIKDEEGTYESLRGTVQKYSDEIGLSIEAYDAIDIFPPLIAKRILEYYT
jgi:hypothetical protein